MKPGLVLTGGGARAAYQAGVLKGVGEILGEKGDYFPFPIVSGISAGAINASFVAHQGDSYRDMAAFLEQTWGELTLESVVRTDFRSFAVLSTRWLKDLGLGGWFGSGGGSTYLLDTTPLQRLLGSVVSFHQIHANLKSGKLHGVAFSATNYTTGMGISFYDGAPGIKPWCRAARVGVRDRLTLRHVLASASIPMLFPPVRLKGSYYGDGSVRLNAPLSPAIHLGADKLFVIGMRHKQPEETPGTHAEPRGRPAREVTLADIAGVLLNANFFDTLDADVERMERINQTVSLLSKEARLAHPQGLRAIPIFLIRPSQDLGTLASDEFKRFPRLLRHFLSGIGASYDQGWDLLSYLAFDKTYTRLLLALGREDALARRDEIEAFFAPC